MSGYQRINFKDQNVERPKTYDVTNNPDGSITLIESFGNVEELGTPINQENMNHIEDGIAAVSFSKFNINSVYQQDDFVTYVENNQLKIYKSLMDNNFGNELADVSFWEEVNFAGDDGELVECHVIIETYQNGTSWYRIWSDGWCEQGGVTSDLTANASNTINLLKSYKDTNYVVIANGHYSTSASTGGVDVFHSAPLTTDTFNINRDYTSGAQVSKANWKACGYIEV